MAADTKVDIKRFGENLSAERNAVALYRRLAQHEPNTDLQKLYNRLADTGFLVQFS